MANASCRWDVGATISKRIELTRLIGYPRRVPFVMISSSMRQPFQLALIVIGFGLAPMTWATPANKQAFTKHFGRFLKSELNSCATCHVRADAHEATSLKDFPHNPFGDRLRQLGDKLTLDERLDKVATEDADGDGVPNLNEILTGAPPGASGKDKRDATKLLKEFAAFRASYRWEPFKTVKRPAIPETKDAKWLRNPIDAYVAVEREKRGLQPAPPASREVLLRRAYLDLIGLAPTPAQLEAFLKDDSKDAFEKVVNELLDQPAYGERWGRHWMDVWRYSDWAGYKAALRDSQHHIWHWRDWIVESLNSDKSYARMVVEMLAADELDPTNDDALRATGYLARNYFINRDQWMDNVVKHTSQAFLGVTMGCVKCHDHFYDPFPHTDYYAMRAIFESYNVRTDRLPGELDIAKDGIPRAFDSAVTVKTFLFERGDERRPVKDQPIAPGVPKSLGGKFEVQSIKLPLVSYHPDRRQFVKDDLIDAAQKRLVTAKEDLEKNAAELNLAALQAVLQVEALEDAGKKDSEEWKQAALRTTGLQRDSALADARWKLAGGEAAKSKATSDLKAAKSEKNPKNKSNEVRATRALAAADKSIAAAKKTLAAAEKGMKTEVTVKYEPRKQPKYPTTTSGRRLAFANWLTAKENPLAARVAMNHIWLRHFGRAIVPTVAEFGGNGREPTHPALLDWLATEFMARDWSMKQMHRLIMTSATYRMAGTEDVASAKIDPDNVYLWRMPSRRMEGEIVRDNFLHIAGTMDKTIGGPDIDNNLAQTSKRRSIYLRHAHEKLVEFVQIFDGPKVSECYSREESIQPHQALALANSKLTFDQAKVLAAKLTESTSADDAKFIDAAYLKILSRRPNSDERNLCLDFLERGAMKAVKNATERARENLVMVLFNHNDFVTIR